MYLHASVLSLGFPRLISLHERPGYFVPLATLPSHAAAGLASANTSDGRTLLVLANFWGGTSHVFAFAGGALTKLQELPTDMAHDWEIARLSDGRTHAIVANYGGAVSTVYQLSDPRVPPPEPLPPPPCSDQHAACRDWQTAGECEHNPTFMRAQCQQSCGSCAAPGAGPFVPVQLLPTEAASAAHHFVVRTAGGPSRDFLLVAQRRVALFEFDPQAAQWRLFLQTNATGICEFASCEAPSGEAVLVFAQWHAGGTFRTASSVYAFDPAASQPLQLLQELPTLGAHDAECFTVEGGEGSETLLAIANVRDDASQRVSSAIYRLDGRALVEAQRLDTVGAHDLEPLWAGGRRLLAVANQGDGTSCNASVDVYAHAPRGWELLQSLPTGCCVYVHSFRDRGRLLLGAAVERIGSEPAQADTYRTDSLVFEWIEQTY